MKVINYIKTHKWSLLCLIVGVILSIYIGINVSLSLTNYFGKVLIIGFLCIVVPLFLIIVYANQDYEDKGE